MSFVVLCVYLVEATEVRCLLIGVLLQPSGSFTGGLLEHKPTPPEDLTTENDGSSVIETGRFITKLNQINEDCRCVGDPDL